MSVTTCKKVNESSLFKDLAIDVLFSYNDGLYVKVSESTMVSLFGKKYKQIAPNAEVFLPFTAKSECEYY